MIPLNEIVRVDKEINNIIWCIVEADREVTTLTVREVEAYNKNNKEAELKFRDRITELDNMIIRRKVEVYELLLSLREKSK